jgi:hypothetical protein
LTTVLWGHDTKKHKVNKQEESSLEALKSIGAGEEQVQLKFVSRLIKYVDAG